MHVQTVRHEIEGDWQPSESIPAFVVSYRPHPTCVWRKSMPRCRTVVGLITGVVVVAGTHGQAQRAGTTTNVNWALHNLDLAGSRFSPLDQINVSNVKSLAPRWLFQHGVIDGVSNQTTPVMVDGIAYITDARGSV